jgi:hypothetical protein
MHSLCRVELGIIMMNWKHLGAYVKMILNCTDYMALNGRIILNYEFLRL